MPGGVFFLTGLLGVKFFILQQIFEESWEYAEDVYARFIDIEKAYYWVSRKKLQGVLQEYGADGRLLLVVKSLYFCRKVCHCRRS